MTDQRLLPFVPRLAIDWAAHASEANAQTLHGSMVFVDISGFTKMSERLARRGKIGAEEVTDVMNSTFSALLEIAYRHGGGLIKFGGDALLLWFHDQDHAMRAVRAAGLMRAALREGGRIATSAGSVLLRMSVGVHSGEFCFFLVGRSHRELIVTGPAATCTVQMEQAAEAGDVLLSPDAAALMPRGAVGRAKGPGRLLRSIPLAPEPGLFGPPPAGVDLSSLVPVGLRERLASGVTEPEHRQATIAFVHFDGTDQLIRQQGLAACADALEEMTSVVQAAADDHGVTFLATDVDVEGGKFILTAGAPVATQQDDQRILLAVRSIVDSGCDLAVGIGVNRGAIFAGDVGAPYRRTYTVMGDAVNLAARLMAKAESGQVIAAPAVVERSGTVFATSKLPAFTVKGKAAPVEAVVLGPATGARRQTSKILPFVGREFELEQLTTLVGRARKNKGQIVELVGEAGIGKTRLAMELRSRATAFRHLTAVSEPYATSTPYFTFRALLRDLLDVPLTDDAAANTAALSERLAAIAPDLIPWLPLLAVPLDTVVRATHEADEIDSKFRKARTHEATGSLLAALLPEPTVMLFEDAYWMDEASRDLVLDIAARHPDAPWILCMTRRPNTLGFSTEHGMPSTTIKLEPLSAQQSASLAATAFEGTDATPARIEALSERAGGNPLFLQELVAAAADDLTSASLPESIEAVVTARIDTLAQQDRTLLRYASVLGTSFSERMVAEIVADDGIETDPGVWNRLVDFVDPEPEGRYRFQHALFRDVAYEALPFRRRRLLHRRAGEIYERRRGDDRDRYVELLSLHFHRAQIFDKSWQYSRAAADGARAKYAVAEAAELYRRALEASRKVEVASSDVATVAEALGDVCETAGEYAEAADAYKQARRLTRTARGDDPELLMKEGVLRERAGKYAESLRWYARGIRLLRESAVGGDVSAARLSLASAGVRFRQGRYAECIRLCESVVAAGAPPAQQAHAYYLLLGSHATIGSPKRAEYRGLALPIYEDLGDLQGQANVLNNLGIDAYYEGRWEEALSLYRRSREARERIGDAIGAIVMTNNIGELLSDQGHVDDAAALFKDVVAVCRASGYRLGIVFGSSNLARAAARAGRIAEAVATLEACLAEFKQMDADSFILDSKARLAECAVFDGRSEEALARATEAVAQSAAAGGHKGLESMLHRLIGYAHLQQGRMELAQDALDESLLLAVAARAAYEEALTHLAWSDLAKRSGHAEGAEHQRIAGQMFARLGVVSAPRIPLIS